MHREIPDYRGRQRYWMDETQGSCLLGWEGMIRCKNQNFTLRTKPVPLLASPTRPPQPRRMEGAQARGSRILSGCPCILVMNVKRMVKLLDIKAQKVGILQTGWKKRIKEQEKSKKLYPKLIWSRFQLPQPLQKGELTRTSTFSEIARYTLDKNN